MKVRAESRYQKGTTTNGIRVITERMPHVRSVSIGAWVLVGARDESLENNGVSHFVEHMLFKGTRNRSAADIARSLESVGGHLNAFTSKELTCYYAHVLDEDLPLALDVISDILANSVFDEKEMAKEKRVVLEELSAIEETPEELVHDIFWEGLFPGHPLGYSIIGKRDIIQALERSTVVSYVDKNYTANRIVVAAAGNVQHDELVRLVERRFAKFEAGTPPTYKRVKAPLTKSNVVENGAVQAHVCLGASAYSYGDKRKFDLLVLNTLLGSGMSSRLFQNIREKYGMAYSVYSFVDFLFDTGVFGVYIGTDRDSVDRAVELIRQELRQLCTEDVSADELDRTKSQLKGNLMLGLENTASIMNRIAKMEIYLNDYFCLDDTLAGIEAVSSASVRKTATELFVEDNLYTTVLKPKADEQEREK